MINKKLVIVILCILLTVGCSNNDSYLNEKIDSRDKEIVALRDEIMELKDQKGELEKLIDEMEVELSKSIELQEELESLKELNDALLYDKDVLLNNIHPIEQAYAEEWRSWTGNTMDAVDISNTYKDMWAEEIDKQYNSLLETLDDDKKQFLISSQDEWENDLEVHSELVLQWTNQIYGDGTIKHIIFADSEYEIYKYRAMYLMNLQ